MKRKRDAKLPSVFKAFSLLKNQESRTNFIRIAIKILEIRNRMVEKANVFFRACIEKFVILFFIE